MRYVALLRGINVGGSRKIGMADLKSWFEAAGVGGVRTYINSGNAVFESSEDRTQLPARLQQVICERSGLEVDVQLRDEAQLDAVAASIPEDWANDSSMKCDVLFLQADVDDAGILEELGPRPGIEDALYVPGAVIWRIDRVNATKNRLTRIVGTPLYGRMTIRNCNTVRKLRALLEHG